MNQLNSIILEGNLVKDCEISEPVSGFVVAKMTLAVNRYYRNRNGEDVNEVSYFDIEAYGQMAQFCQGKAVKGRGIRVVGRLKQNVWQNSEGKAESRVFVVAEHIEYKSVKKDFAPDEKKTEEKNAESQSNKAEQTEQAVCF